MLLVSLNPLIQATLGVNWNKGQNVTFNRGERGEPRFARAVLSLTCPLRPSHHNCVTAGRSFERVLHNCPQRSYSAALCSHLGTGTVSYLVHASWWQPVISLRLQEGHCRIAWGARWYSSVWRFVYVFRAYLQKLDKRHIITIIQLKRETSEHQDEVLKWNYQKEFWVPRGRCEKRNFLLLLIKHNLVIFMLLFSFGSPLYCTASSIEYNLTTVQIVIYLCKFYKTSPLLSWLALIQ